MCQPPQAGEGPSLPHLLGGEALRTFDFDEAGTGGSGTGHRGARAPASSVCVRCRHVFFNEFVYLWLCRVFMLCGLFSSCGEQGLLSLGAGGA